MKLTKIPYGGDYNPEQWPPEVWEEDMRLLKKAHIDMVTLNTFSWAALQPSENEYCFDRLDRIMELVRENGLKVCLATSTAAHPAWMAMRYPEVLRTEFNGMKRKFGGRHNSCPNSPVYRKYSARLAGLLAERYKNYDNIAAWHISNEYGGECYCDNCQRAFRVWLKEKYKTLETLNKAWNTSFWGHTYYQWDEIVVPNLLSEHFAYDRTMFQGISLDYRRFNSDSLLECYKGEYMAIKAITPKIPITTNLMGAYKPLNYQKWAEYMDFISWDNYPSNESDYPEIAFHHDLMRGLKQGKPFWLMEQTPSVTNWLPYNELKRPGVMRLWSYQAVAHGADSVMFFQMRRSIGGCEKMHGAIIDHAGTENTRVFREAAALGKELEELGDSVMGSRIHAACALIFDWENWWALEYCAGPSRRLSYLEEVLHYYKAFSQRHIPVDIIGSKDSLEGYQVVAAPLLYMTAGDIDERIRQFVQNGGSFVTTFFSGIVDEHDLVITGGYPGRLKDILGIWVEESDALPEKKINHFTWKGQTYPAGLLCDLLHCRGARAEASYEEDFYAGMPALTCNQFGKGTAWYVATQSSEAFYRELVGEVCKEAGVEALYDCEPEVEVVKRENGQEAYWFMLNHSQETKRVALPKGGRLLIGKAEEPDPEGYANLKPGEVWLICCSLKA